MRLGRLSRLGLIAAVGLGLGLGMSMGCASWPLSLPGRAPAPPKLVVLLVVDQLRPDRLAPGQPDGLGRLQREGRVFSEAALDFAFSETCPGHVTAVTGRYPSRAGIPANRFVLEETLERVYCVLDRTSMGALRAAAPPEAIPSAPGAGRSPVMLRSDGLGDWLKAAFPAARVHTLSGKDRSAIALGGQRPDGAWWVDVAGSGALTTSRYYRLLAAGARTAAGGAADAAAEEAPLPEWAARWTRERLLEGVPARWTHPSHDPRGRIRHDDYPAEDPWASRTSPHPLHQPIADAPRPKPDAPAPAPRVPVSPDERVHESPTNLPRDRRHEPSAAAPPMPPPALHGDEAAARRKAMRRVAASPYLDRRLLEVALDVVDAESLGRRKGAGPDLLAIGLSATDLVGHLYGPFSQESRAALSDLDEAIGELMAALEERLGRDRVGIVLTADHGVLPLPEWTQQADLPENSCPVAGGRVAERPLIGRILAHVEAAVGNGPVEGDVPWLVVDGLRLHADRARLVASGISQARVDEAIRAAVAAEPALARVWSRDELGRPFVPDGRAASGAAVTDASLQLEHRLLRHSLVPGRAPDWILLPHRGCLVTGRERGTSHGSPYDYDRRVPLVFWGPGVEPGVDARRARLVDLAPTLARWLGIPLPADLDGAPLPLAGEE